MTSLASHKLYRWLAVIIVIACGYALLNAQSGCPTVTQQVSSSGTVSWGLQLASTVQVNVQVVDTSQGDFSASEVSAISTASSGLASAINQVPGSNVTSTVENTDTPPNLNDGTTTAPIIEVEMASQDQVNSACNSNANISACTVWNNDPNGHTINATILVLPAAAASSSTFEQLMTHEFGHSDLGENECIGCANTIMNPDVTSSSPKAPTSCDVTRIKGCECKS